MQAVSCTQDTGWSVVKSSPAGDLHLTFDLGIDQLEVSGFQYVTNSAVSPM
jgi:hypothetical protein